MQGQAQLQALGGLSLPAEGKKGDKQHREGGRERAQKAKLQSRGPGAGAMSRR